MENSERTSRSIFVGNIPYEAREEELIKFFTKAGPVSTFRLVFDRESGKSKGYGFCEYHSSAVAASAIRNLKDIDFQGRALRIGGASGEQNNVEQAVNNTFSILKHPIESPYGERVDAHLVGPSIAQAVASIPPEQLYDLMSQMKLSIETNPKETRQLLLDNPQLTYALMQAQLTMRIIEPNVAISMMTRTNDQTLRPVVQPQPTFVSVPNFVANCDQFGQINGQMPNMQLQNGQMPNMQLQNGQMPNMQFQNGQMPNMQLQNGQMPNMQHQNGQMPNMQLQNGQMPNMQLQNGQMPNMQLQNGQMPNMQFQNGQMPNLMPQPLAPMHTNYPQQPMYQQPPFDHPR